MMDKNDIDAATRNRERIKHLQTREKKEEIVDRYQKGDKTASIQEDYDIGPGELYPILHKAGVPLRSKNPPIIPEKVTPPPDSSQKIRSLSMSRIASETVIHRPATFRAPVGHVSAQVPQT